MLLKLPFKSSEHSWHQRASLKSHWGHPAMKYNTVLNNLHTTFSQLKPTTPLLDVASMLVYKNQISDIFFQNTSSTKFPVSGSCLLKSGSKMWDIVLQNAEKDRISFHCDRKHYMSQELKCRGSFSWRSAIAYSNTYTLSILLRTIGHRRTSSR